MVIDAPKIAELLPSFLEFIGDSIIVGHNIRFDMSFLNAAAMRHGYERLPQKTVDTAALARRLIRNEVRNLRLQTLAAHFRSPTQPNHRALEDARATAHVLHAMLERAGTIGVTNLDDLLQLPTAKGSPHYSKIKLTERLPRKPGVYIFRDRNGHPIYVGKATNLRARVRQYFYGDRRRTIADMMRELEAVDHQVCDTTLEAEVAEIRLIHAYRPRYNRRSRPPKASHYVKLTKETLPRLSVVRKLRDDAILYLGPFRSKRAAELVVAALWDASPIRRCRSRAGSRDGRCAESQLGVALCPCDGTLKPDDYRPVVDQLLEAVDQRPSLLLDSLVGRMQQLSSARRYEEAGWVRDRHDALARAIERRHAWQALQGLGLCEVEDGNGSRFILDHGRLVASWSSDRPSPLRPVGVDDRSEWSEVPPSVEIGEETQVIWRWIESSDPRIIEASGSLALPREPVVRLTLGRTN
jgi:DNA polymerase-3 subunit epsilon